MNAPRNLLEVIRYFSDPGTCLKFAVELRWPNGPVCPRCGSKEHSFLSTRNIWKCKGCKKQYSVKVGTIFEDSAIPLDKWMAAVWLVVNAKNGISSYEIARGLSVTQKTAWFMAHRIRLALQTGSFDKKLSGEVEVDETYIGGKARNMHHGKRKVVGRGSAGKAIVMGLLERHGEVRTKVIPNPRRGTLQPEVKAHVAFGSKVYTDALASYAGLAEDFQHKVIDHAECYVKGQVHTNGMENYWSLLKRGLKGTYVSVEPYHLFRYLDEQAFRFNEREGDDSSRFLKAMGSVAGKRLTFKRLTGSDAVQESSEG